MEYRPKITVLPTEAEFDRYAARKVVEAIKSNPKIHLTMPTGKTPEGMYALLADACRMQEISFGEVVICNLDEYWPINPEAPDSYASYMKDNLISKVDIKPGNWHIPRGDAPDPQEEAESYDELVSELGIDLAVLGLGPGLTCHIGFNEVGASFDTRTRLVRLDPVTAEVNKRHFVNKGSFVTSAITQGLGTIMEARKIVLLAKGLAKANGVGRFLLGPIDEDCPVSVLRTREYVEVILDSEAASKLN